MSRTTNARIAGVTLLLYIAVGVTQTTLFGGTTAGEGMAARLASMAARATDVRVNVALGLLTCIIALVVGVALWAITREQDQTLAMLALCCRIAEGVTGAIYIPMTLALLSLATEVQSNPSDAAATHAVASLVLAARRWNPVIGATFFAVGSTIFSWLLLRGRIVPAALAWLGVVASALLVIALPLQLTAVVGGGVAQLAWLPMLAFEVPLGLWLIVKGVPASVSRV